MRRTFWQFLIKKTVFITIFPEKTRQFFIAKRYDFGFFKSEVEFPPFSNYNYPDLSKSVPSTTLERERGKFRTFTNGDDDEETHDDSKTTFL